LGPRGILGREVKRNIPMPYHDSSPEYSSQNQNHLCIVVTGLPDFQYRLRQAARDYREYREHSDLIKPHTDELDTDTGCKPQNQTRSKPEEKLDPSKELGIQLKKTSPSDTSGNEPSPLQEHSASSSASRMYLNQLHAWQFFN
jgi:hypothetical protein